MFTITEYEAAFRMTDPQRPPVTRRRAVATLEDAATHSTLLMAQPFPAGRDPLGSHIAQRVLGWTQDMPLVTLLPNDHAVLVENAAGQLERDLGRSFTSPQQAAAAWNAEFAVGPDPAGPA